MSAQKKTRFIIENNTIRPLPTGIHYPIKKRAHLKTLLSTLAAVTTLGTLSLKYSASKPNAEKAPRKGHERVIQPEPHNMQFYEVNTLETQRAFQQLSNALHQVSNNRLSDAQVQQQALLLQTLSTKTDGTCAALTFPMNVLKDFSEMCRYIPSNQMESIIRQDSANPPFYSFKQLTQALQKAQINLDEIRQQIFLQKARYETHARLAAILPIFENNTNWIYLDAATKLEKGVRVPDDHPTVHIGLNLHAHPELLAHIRILNSPQLQEILYPQNPEQRSSEEYIHLSPEELNRWVKSALDAGLHNYKAEHFKKVYGLFIHPDDMAYLDARFQRAVAEAVNKAEKELEKREGNFVPQNESVMFGSFVKPVPMRMACVAADLAYSSKHPLRDTKGWPTFCKLYENREFYQASKQTRAGKAGLKRNLWRRFQMIPNKERAEGAALIGLGGLGVALLWRAKRKRRHK